MYIRTIFLLIPFNYPMIKSIAIVFIFYTCISAVKAQATIDSISTQNSVVDSTSVKDDPYGVFDMFKGNPGKAALYSLVIPGGGQVYNKQYWKVPIAWAAEGVAIYNLVGKWQTYKRWDVDWKRMVVGETPINTALTNIEAVKEIRDDEREERDQAWLIVIGVHLIITADAFVSRHLIEFDVDDDITIEIDPISPYPGFNLTMNF